MSLPTCKVAHIRGFAVSSTHVREGTEKKVLFILTVISSTFLASRRSS